MNTGIVSNPAAPFGGVKASGLGREGGRVLICRLAQGFSAGGEYGGAAVYMAESAPAQNWRQLLVLAGFVVLLNVVFHLILGYMPTYMSGQLGHSTAQGNWMLVAVMALMLLAIPPVGALSDRIGRKPRVLATFCCRFPRSCCWVWRV